MKLDEYSAKTQLPLDFLAKVGVREQDGTLAIPYFDASKNLFRLRLREGDKRWWGTGSGMIPYGLWRLENNPGLYTCLGEGESDTQTLWFHDIRALGIPGASTFKSEWGKYLADFDTVYLCGDGDEAGRLFNRNVAAKLREGGYQGQIKIITMPRGVKDINALHCQNPERFKTKFKTLEAAAEDAEETDPPASSLRHSPSDAPVMMNNEGSNILPFIQLRDVVPQKVDFTVEDFLPTGYVTTIFGEGGHGKSYLALYVAVCVASGKACLGKEVKKGRVTYVDFELEKNVQASRALEISRGLGLDSTPEGLLYLSPGTQKDVPTKIEQLVKGLKKAVDEKGIHLTVIDSFGAAVQGDAESAKDVCTLFQRLRGLGTILMIDHQSKVVRGETYREKKPFGSIYKHNLARNIYQLRIVSELQDEKKAILNHNKCNFTAVNEPISLRLKFGENTFEVDLCELTEEFSEHVSVEQQIMLAFKTLEKATANEISEHTGLVAGTVRNMITRLKDKNQLIEIDKEGKAPVYALKVSSSQSQVYRDDESDERNNVGALAAEGEVIEV